MNTDQQTNYESIIYTYVFVVHIVHTKLALFDILITNIQSVNFFYMYKNSIKCQYIIIEKEHAHPFLILTIIITNFNTYLNTFYRKMNCEVWIHVLPTDSDIDGMPFASGTWG